jgi:hypothetical protein
MPTDCEIRNYNCRTSYKIRKIDIALISDAHFTTRTMFKIQYYKVYHVPHWYDTPRGGTAIIIRSAVTYHELWHHQSDKIQAANTKVDAYPWLDTMSAKYCPPRHAKSAEGYIVSFQSLRSKFLTGGFWSTKHNEWGMRFVSPKGRNLLHTINRQTCKYLSTGEPTY